MLEASDVLTTIAEVGVAVAGFSGVVVVVGRRSDHQLDPRQIYYVRALLEVAATAVFFSLLPLVLDRALAEETVWRASMILYGSGHFVGVTFHYLTTRGSVHVSPYLRLSMLLGAGIGVAQLACAFAAPIRVVEPFYLGVLTWHLCIGGFYFGLLLLSSQESSA